MVGPCGGRIGTGLRLLEREGFVVTAGFIEEEEEEEEFMAVGLSCCCFTRESAKLAAIVAFLLFLV